MTKRVFAVVILAFSLLFLFTHFSYALYSWVDEKGVTHFTDYPKPTKEREEEPKDEKQENVSPSGQTGASAPARQDQEIKRPIVAPIVKQPEAQQKAVPSAQPPTDTQAQKPGAAAPPMPAQPTSKGTLTIPVPIAQPQPMVTPPTGQGSARPEMRAPLSQHDKETAALASVLMNKFMPIFLLVIIGFYLYYCLCTYLIAKKLDVPAAWTAWIPILQIWAFMRSAGKPFWWVLLLFSPLIGIFIVKYLPLGGVILFITQIISFIIYIYLWICIVENLGKNKWLGLLMLVPIINMIYLGVLAFSSKEA